MDIACLTKHELVPGESKNGLPLSIIQGLLGAGGGSYQFTAHASQGPRMWEGNLNKHLCIYCENPTRDRAKISGYSSHMFWGPCDIVTSVFLKAFLQKY